MNPVEYRVKLDVTKPGRQAQVHVKQNDTKSRKINIYLFASTYPFDISEVSSAVIRAQKPDDTILFNACELNSDHIAYVITNQTIAVAGTVICEVTLYGKDGQVLATPCFSIEVEAKLYSDNEIESKDEFTALEEAMKKAANVKDGTTFTPSVSENGDLSWSNDGGFENPETVNIKGNAFKYEDFTEEQLSKLKGEKGDKGDTGATGPQGNPGVYIVGDGERPDGTVVEVDFDGDNVGELLPVVTADDEDKILKVVDGAWGLVESKDAAGDTHTHENKHYIDKFGETIYGYLTYNGEMVGGVRNIRVTRFENSTTLIIEQVDDEEGLVSSSLLTIPHGTKLPEITEEDVGKIVSAQEGEDGYEYGLADAPKGNGIYIGSGDMPEGYDVQIDPSGDDTRELLPSATPEDVGKTVVVKENGYGLEDFPVENIFIEMIEIDGVGSLVDTTYEDIDKYINERKNVIIFWKVNSNSVRYYTYTDKRPQSGNMTHVFGYHFDVSHESVFVKEDGTVSRGGQFTAVSTVTYNKHIAEYNAFVESIPTATEEDNGKILTVQNGAYALTAIPNYEEVEF